MQKEIPNFWRALAFAPLFLLAACEQPVENGGEADMEAAGTAPADELMALAQELFEPIPLEPADLPGNPLSVAKIELGKTLYFDPRLSRSQVISCNSCHIIGLGGADGRSTSIGHGWQLGGRNSPTVLNAVYNLAQFWDGRARDLEAQAGGPVENPVEMAFSHDEAMISLKTMPGYAALFKAAFPGEDQALTIDNLRRAIAAFEATLITPNAPFDLYLKGDNAALSGPEKEGLQLFIDTGCAACHSGINLGGGQYAAFGIVEHPGENYLPADDIGREEVTGDPADRYAYKVPTLRNIALTAPYFHTGRAWTLAEAITVMGRSQTGADLSPDEIAKIEAFLLTLTGDQPEVTYPILPPRSEKTSKPEN